MAQHDHQQLTELAKAAFQVVERQVAERALETRTSVIVFENGLIQRVDPQEILERLSKTETLPG
ncbi:MAG: hypothetical protein ACRC8S_17665 [Fimbriiglobus sp.]